MEIAGARKKNGGTTTAVRSTVLKFSRRAKVAEILARPLPILDLIERRS
jgi:hypothetical protein